MTAQRTNQAVRYTAIISASAASLTLTVAAGTYVMNQLAPGVSSTGPETALDRPDHSLVEAAPRIGRGSGSATAAPGSPAPATFAVSGEGSRAFLPAFSEPPAELRATRLPATDHSAVGERAEPEPAARSVPGEHADLGIAVLDARRDEQHTTITLTVDPGVSSALHGLLTESDRVPGGSTTLSTEIDRVRGGMAIGLSDPVLGERAVQIPGTRTPPRSAGAVPV